MTAPTDDNELRKPRDWEQHYGKVIIDPDGWRFEVRDRSEPKLNPKPFDEPITYAEFVRRAGPSTVRPLRLDEATMRSGETLVIERTATLDTGDGGNEITGVHVEPARDPHPSVSELAAAVETAALMLDTEEHRYVERFTDCPNGCVYELATEAVIESTLGVKTVALEHPQLVRTAGPESCECTDGSAEDERAEHLDPLIGNLHLAADMLRKAAELAR